MCVCVCEGGEGGEKKKRGRKIVTEIQCRKRKLRIERERLTDLEYPALQ